MTAELLQEIIGERPHHDLQQEKQTKIVASYSEKQCGGTGMT